MTINAIILAAGRGSRMKGLTEEIPKCLIKIADKRLLDWQILALEKAGIKKITVVRGYQGKKIKGSFQTLENDGWAETNMVSTLICASPILHETDCIISYSDILYHPDHISQLLLAKGDICITYDTNWESLWRLRFDNLLSDAETFKQNNGLLEDIGDKADSLDKISGQYMGLTKFTPKGWEKVSSILKDMSTPKIANLDMTALLKILLKKNIPVHVMPVHGKWCEIDSEQDLKQYNDKITNESFWKHDWRF